MPRDIDRLYASVAAEGADSCWVWIGATSHGYGSVTVGGVRLRAHRWSYELHYGPIPPGMLVLHSCDNPPCVNPAHLSVGTQFDNMRDMAAKGRAAAHALTTCPAGHPLGDGNGRPGRGRTCWTCHRQRSNRDKQLVSSAARASGLTKRQYVEAHGWSTITARAILGERAS